ncbi:sortase SrtA [Lactococcus cremoris subsp. cremoris UC509.9]|uniref:Sortase n=1 Tax=Lactococcus lactis subsp. cremoris TaxID=1359 RepID=A0AAJ6MHW3_LACLC|nr:sortase [Lactococcus cremoris]AFW91663.1 sortase SrtA [Lactococcus cremoris subsp. cremoris UC509.9]ARD91362.1 sortase [Lactococcus cremoris]MRM68136.1 sortase [Lactococcus cremoris]QJD19926.1 sortase [Lactococcus cremoris]QRZ29876.1 sortase SrtA [Lactococcus cremoris]
MEERTKNKNKKRKYNWLLNTFIVLLFIVGLVLIFNKPIRNMMIATKSNHYQLQNVSKEKIGKNKKADVSFDFAAVKSVDFQSVLSNQFDSQPLPVIGGIAIPELNINLPIFKGVGNTSLLYGAGTMKGDQVMGEGNYTLAGHNMTGFTSDLSILFTPLEKAKAGMSIYVTDKNNVYQYKIDKIDVVTPEHVEVLNDTPGKKEITLVTCADAESTHRIIVHGTFVDEKAYDKVTDSVKNAFEKKYNQINNF